MKALYIDPSDMSLEGFSKLVKSTFKINVTYSILYKVKYNDANIGMIGSQEGFTLNSFNDSNSIYELWHNLNKGIHKWIFGWYNRFNSDDIYNYYWYTRIKA